MAPLSLQLGGNFIAESYNEPRLYVGVLRDLRIASFFEERLKCFLDHVIGKTPPEAS